MNELEYTDLMLEIGNKIFNKRYTGFIKNKEDMLQSAYVNVWSSRDKFNSSKGRLESFIATLFYNSFNNYIRYMYRGKDMFVSANANITTDEEESSLLDIIGNEDLNYKNIEYDEFMKEFDRIVELENKSQAKKTNIDELHEVIDMLLMGYSQKSIADKKGCTKNCIHKKVKRIQSVLNEIKNN